MKLSMEDKNNKKVKTYMDELLKDEKFKAEFEAEYQKLLISEKIAKLRKVSHLTQKALAKKNAYYKICHFAL